MADDLQRERKDLIMADRHLAAGEKRMAKQLALIEDDREGYETARAKDLLRCWTFPVTWK